MHPKNLQIEDFSYELPEEAIAVFPLENRDSSKLLTYQKGTIEHTQFTQFPLLLASDSLLVLNNTKVFHARLLFKKPSGGLIEIFCLHPELPAEHHLNFASKTECQWQCYIGNAKKWKAGLLELQFEYKGTKYACWAELIEKKPDCFVVKFSWNAPDLCFLDLTEILGKLPIPPYLKREAETIDEHRYQTVFAEQTGSVAAPTASLHFTPHIFEQLNQNGIHISNLTLHVGAGTFKPVTAQTIADHQMHHETLEIGIDTLLQIVHTLKAKQAIICVGTTALRSLESIYWHAWNVFENNADLNTIFIDQWMPYENNKQKHALTLLEHLISKMQQNKTTVIRGSTGILIAPGYQFKLANALVTNFHQPKSTLLLLIAAITGEHWKRIYEAALENKYRFLSYGDSSLLWINQ